MSNIFGKAITRKFYPIEGGEPISLVSQAPSIYLFTTQPSLTAARAGTGAAATIAYWIANAQIPYECTYTIPAIDDPAPTSATQEYDYWEAINYKVDSLSNQTQTVLRTLPLSRALGTESIPDTTLQDIKNIYPMIISYAEDLDLAAFMSAALTELKIELKSKGLEWGRVTNLKDLKLALAYKTIQFMAESEIVEDNDKFVTRRQIYKERYDNIMKMVQLEQDTTLDGKPDQTVQADSIAVIGIR